MPTPVGSGVPHGHLHAYTGRSVLDHRVDALELSVDPGGQALEVSVRGVELTLEQPHASTLGGEGGAHASQCEVKLGSVVRHASRLRAPDGADKFLPREISAA